MYHETKYKTAHVISTRLFFYHLRKRYRNMEEEGGYVTINIDVKVNE